MKNIEIRIANIEDLNDLVRLRILMQTEVNNVAIENVSDEYKSNVRKYFETSIPTKIYRSSVAVHENKIVAAAGVCFYEKPPSIAGGTGLVGYVTNVYTEKQFRKNGIGTKLMSALVQLAKEMRADKLHLGATEDGLGIYRSVGFNEPRFVNLECKTHE